MFIAQSRGINLSSKKLGKEVKEESYRAEQAALGFERTYWQENYSEPAEMDGIVNCAQHAQYMKAFFDVDYVDINTIIDFGFGLGFIFQEALKIFNPYRAWGIEPSADAFNEVSKRAIAPNQSTKLTLKKWDLVKWSENVKENSKWFDLGICTSVFQYLSEEQLHSVLPVMAKSVKYLYFSVPTDFELKRQVSDLEFHDKYAISRPKKFYRKILEPHFTIIGSRLLESKVHFDEDNTFFTDYLFRE
jgi:hypothetical protein